MNTVYKLVKISFNIDDFHFLSENKYFPVENRDNNRRGKYEVYSEDNKEISIKYKFQMLISVRDR